MNATAKIVKYELHDVLRSKWVIIYALFFLIITDLLFRFGGDSARVIISLMNVVLIIIPLISIIFGTMYIYNSREFVELLLSQPINRRSLFRGMYAGLTLPLAGGYLLGVGLPFALHASHEEQYLGQFVFLLLSGVFLTFIFIGLAFLISVGFEDKVKGLGVSILFWLFFAVIYDALFLFFMFLFGDYPLEKVGIALTLLNPVDLARIFLLLKLDISALMGYTGAVFHKFFGSMWGIFISLAAMSLWAVVPYALGLWLFERKDF